jgi:uncharacterized damage-inducible protein DinB
VSDLPRLDITPFWATVNHDLITIVDSIPDDKLNWTPKPDLWNFRGILLHIAAARDGWLGRSVRDGETPASVYQTTRTKVEIRREYQRTWERTARFVSDAEKLDATYETSWADNPQPEQVTGHWIAFHLLEHDIHHRSDLLHYLALLGVPMPEVGPL